MLKFSKNHKPISKKNVQNFSRVDQVVYLSSPISLSSFKAIVSIVFEVPCLIAKKCQTFQRAVTQEKP